MSSIQFQPLLHLTFAEAEKFLASHGFTAFQTYAESARLIVPETMKTVPNRAELELYCDANSEHRVYKADIYRDGKLLTTIEIDECGECGGICDGVHAKVSSFHSSKERKIQELVDTLRKQPQAILEEAIRQVSAERVKTIVNVLKVQDPEILNEVINRLAQ